MNLIEHWGSGIPRIIGKVKAAGLREPEFVGGEVDLRINIYRRQIDGTNSLQHSADSIETAVKPPLNRQETADNRTRTKNPQVCAGEWFHFNSTSSRAVRRKRT